MRISQRSIEDVREAANIVEVASEFTALRRQGARFSGLCPYPDHQEKTPSFSVSPDKGFCYCFGCLDADERIWTSRGLVPIGAAEVGDEVIGLDGRRERITDKWFKSGPTIGISTGAAREGLKLTPDHTCLYITREEALRAVPGLRLSGPNEKSLRLSHDTRRGTSETRITTGPASDVRVGDFWLYPVIPDAERGENPLPAGDPTDAGLPVNPRTAWLYGVWLAHGTHHASNLGWHLISSTQAAWVSRVLSEELACPDGTISLPEKDSLTVTCSSTGLSTLFARWFGGAREHRRVPFGALRWSQECQAALLDGFMNGHLSESAVMVVKSEELAYGLFALCIQAGRVCSLAVEPVRSANPGRYGEAGYRVRVSTEESTGGFFTTIGGVDYLLSEVRRVWSAGGATTTVVDITTSGSHTFLTKMGVTHNCQRGGDSIKLVMDLKGLDFAEAVSHLAERSGIELQYEGGGDADAASKRAGRRKTIHKALAAAAVYYHKYLLKSQTPEAGQAREYLKGRGLEASTIEEFRLGYAPRGSAGFLGPARKFGIERPILEAAGLLSARGGERFAGRITFPISDRRGRIVGFGARAMGDAQPKYLNSPETEIFNKRDLLYGFPQVADAVRRQRAALIVEGYTDVLMLYQSGVRNAVATLGTATTPSHLRTLSGFVDELYMLFDPDSAGERALERADATVQELERSADGNTVSAAARLKLDLRVVRLPEDPADWLLEHTADEFRQVLRGAVPLLEYLFRRKAERARGAGAAERSRMMGEIQDVIARIDDPVFYRDALRVASEALGVNPQELQTGRRQASATTATPSRTAPRSPFEQVGREVTALMLAHPELTREVLEKGVRVPFLPQPFRLRDSDFADEGQAGLFRLLSDHPGETLDEVLSDERARERMDDLVSLGAEAEEIRENDLHSSAPAVRETWLRLGILSRQRKMRDTPDYDQKGALQAEIQQLREALRVVSS